MAQAIKKTGRHKSAIKADRQAVKRNARNRAAKKEIRLSTRKVLDAALTKEATKAAGALSQVASLLDKAARKGLIHWKAAARRKSHLSRQVSEGLASNSAVTTVTP
jgi:small subunit ribosomal protein S20